MLKNKEVLRCRRCDYMWLPAREKKPKLCPKCKDGFWDTKCYMKKVIGRRKDGSYIFGKKERLEEK